jgi:hypothetical protein
MKKFRIQADLKKMWRKMFSEKKTKIVLATKWFWKEVMKSFVAIMSLGHVVLLDI